MRIFIYSVLHGLASSLVLFFIPYGMVHLNAMMDGRSMDDYSYLAFTTYTCLVRNASQSLLSTIASDNRYERSDSTGH